MELPRTSLTNSLYVGMKDLKNLTKDWEEIQPLTQTEKVPEVTAEEEDQPIESVSMVGKVSTVESWDEAGAKAAKSLEQDLEKELGKGRSQVCGRILGNWRKEDT